MAEWDPVQKLLISFYRERVGRLVRFIIALVGLAGGIFFVEAIFRHLFKHPPEDAFVNAAFIYAGLIVIGGLTYGIWLTILLFRNPGQLFGLYKESENLLNIWLSKLYGIERPLTKEICTIKNDGSYESKIEFLMNATVENIYAVEIVAGYLGPVEDLDIDVGTNETNFSVTPREFGPVDVREVPYKDGYYVARFSKALEKDKDVTLEYWEKGDPNTFATNIQGYPEGISFDYAVRLVAVPTQLLTMEIIFEKEYPLSMSGLPSPIVWYGEAMVEHSKETRRARNYFRYQDRRATLSIPSPLVALHYSIKWAVE